MRRKLAPGVGGVLLLSLVVLADVASAGKFTDWQTGSDPAAKKEEKKEDKLPRIKRPVMFNTPEADYLLSRMKVLPDDSPWKWDVSKLPVAKNSKEMIRAISENGSLRGCWEMAFVIVPSDQVKVPVKLVKYPGESDPGPYPVPDVMPIQGWPMYGGDLRTHQAATGGDRHGIVVDPYSGRLYEFYQARRMADGWEAAQASIFDLTSNRLRPKGWTSADAAGLPIFPGVIRYDEVERGIVAHAMRVTVERTRRDYLYPARHFASPHTDPNLPRMGERLRLRRDFDVSKFPAHCQAVLNGLKKYGMIVADNGGNWDLCLTPDTRIQGMQSLKRVTGRDFEVVDVSALVREAEAKNP
ncbi:MAG TPA: hypothetical protein VMZ92_09480 [Planctomycetota bacterium]|nr:hypothetical protein [Planctomycetota bacterium]